MSRKRKKAPTITERKGTARVSSGSLVIGVDVGPEENRGGGEIKPGDIVVLVVEPGTSNLELRRALSAIYEHHGLPPLPPIPGKEAAPW